MKLIRIEMTIKEFVLKNKYQLIILLCGILAIFVSFFYIGYSSELGSDATEFKQASEFLSSGSVVSPQILINRVLTSPLFLRASLLVDLFTKDIRVSFSIVNVLFYLMLIIAFYHLVLEIYKEEKVALISTLLVVFNYYVIDPGNAHLADMSGWFFLIISTYFAVKYFNTPNKKFYFLSILFSAIGVLFKEYGGLAIINLGLLIILSDFSWREKIKQVIVASLLFIIPLLGWHIFAYFKYHITYFDKFKYVEAISSAPGYQSKSLIIFIKILGWLFSVGWIAFLYGFWKEIEIKNKNRLKIVIACFPATMTFLIWPAITERLAVILLFWLALIAGFGLSKIRWYVLYPFLLTYIWFNCNIKILIAMINLPF